MGAQKGRYVRTALLLVSAVLLLLYVLGNTGLLVDKAKTGFLTDNGLLAGDQKLGPDESEKEEPGEVLVVIDPGHGGADQGTQYGKMLEKDLNLDISLKMGEFLKKEGIKLAFTRETDVDVGLRERADFANDLKAALFISVHNNAMPGNAQYKGTETLYCIDAARDPEKMDGEKLARIVQSELVNSLKTVDNGIIYRPNLAVLRLTKMPAVIAEIAYVSNASDRQKLASEEFRRKSAQALANAVIKALDAMGASRDKAGKWYVLQP